MLTYKCKTCNANLEIVAGSRVAICEFCGTNQALPEGPGENSTKRGYIFLEDGEYKSAKEYFNKALDENAEASEAYLGKVMLAAKIKSKEEFFDLSRGDECLELFRNVKNSVDFKNAVRFALPGAKERLEDFKRNLYELAYNEAKKGMDSDDYDLSLDLLKRLGDYKDSPTLLMQCEEAAYLSENEKNYNQALEYMNKHAYHNAKGIFYGLKNYKDSCELYKECIYRQGEETMKSEEYLESIKIFESITGYKDADKLREKCEKIVSERRAQYAIDSRFMDVENAYEDAIAKMKSGFLRTNYLECEKAFLEIKGYKNAKKMAKRCRVLAILSTVFSVVLALMLLAFIIIVLVTVQ